ncbi:MAG: HPF/RaiA family ribosome-associated protein [Pirellulales bacterium]|nr:HPF/RaiA family ribosome-associated protein [Pirellulales bacterium]
MQVNWSFRKCADQGRKMRAYWEKELPRFERLLRSFPDQLKEMNVTVSRVGRSRRLEARLVVHLPARTLVVKESDKSWHALLDRMSDELLRQIKRHKEKLRADWIYRRKKRWRRDFGMTDAQLADNRAASRREEFIELLRPLMRRIRSHANRALRRLEGEGKLRRGELSVEDLTDEVLVHAWEQYDQRPGHGLSDVWLMRLLNKVIHRLESRPASVSIESTVVPVQEESDTADEDDPYAEFFKAHSLATLADVLPDEHEQAWDTLEPSEQHEKIEKALARMEPQRRLAFTYHALDGFTAAEIAMIQDRPEEEIVGDIEQAREDLRETVIGTSEPRQPEVALVPEWSRLSASE